jgi:hypothetical protein
MVLLELLAYASGTWGLGLNHCAVVASNALSATIHSASDDAYQSVKQARNQLSNRLVKHFKQSGHINQTRNQSTIRTSCAGRHAGMWWHVSGAADSRTELHVHVCPVFPAFVSPAVMCGLPALAGTAGAALSHKLGRALVEFGR